MTELCKAVFLSYASQDAEAAKRLCEALKAAGIEAWFDQSELRGGDAWDQKIRRQIRDCALFIPVISANTASRPEGYFRLEWNLADQRTHMMSRNKAFIVPVCIDDTREAASDVPDSFARVQWTRLPGGEVPPAFVQRVSRLLATGEQDPSPADRMEAPPPAEKRRLRRRWVIAAVILAIVAINTTRVKLNIGNAHANIDTVAVLPFENTSGDKSLDYLGDGISETLISKLTAVKGLRVISRNSAFKFRDRKMDMAQVGRALGVEAIVMGTVELRGDDLAITAELVRPADGTQIWGEKYSRDAGDVLEVEGEIATTIVRNLRTKLSGDEKEKLTRTSTRDPEAYRLYLRGREYLIGTQREMDKSVDFLQQAIKRSPDYALAYAGLAEAYTRQAFLRGEDRATSLEKAREAVKRALEFDPELAEAHTGSALVKFYFEWDWAGAEAEFRKALALNPGSVSTHEEYGVFLMAMGRLDEAHAQSSEAVRLDPASIGPMHDIGIVSLARRDYPQAAATFRRALVIDPNWLWGYIKLARALALQKDCKEALAQAALAETRLGEGSPLAISWLGATYGNCADTMRAREKLERLRAIGKQRYVDPTAFAAIHFALGEIEPGLAAYEKAAADRSPNMVYAKIAPAIFPELQGNARYQAIVDRMGFPK
ncbi:MAG: TIR domain-containing protein [Usitatibacter sp.]